MGTVKRRTTHQGGASMGGSIEEQLAAAGYQLLGTNKKIQTLILDLLEHQQRRYLKAIPYLIYKYQPSIDEIHAKTTNEELFNKLVHITNRIFKEKQIPRTLPAFGPATFSNPHYEEYLQEFELQQRNELSSTPFVDAQKTDEERTINHALSQLFTKKEKQLIKRLQQHKPLSKTDYKYYSRKTKKKLQSIIALQDFATSIFQKTPRYDEQLFKLKRLLQQLIEEQDIKGSIETFIYDKDRLTITTHDGATSLGKRHLKNEELLSLLKRYKNHDFR